MALKNKTQRLLAIRNIITTCKIGTQEELLQKLGEEGLSYTQATLSRDLKFLKVGKIADAQKGYIYFIPEGGNIADSRQANANIDNIPSNGFLSIQFSHNLAVIRTLPGHASSVALRIDMKNPYEIIGTIAGDDTILVIPVEGATRQDVINALIMIMPDLKGKI
jgi:transcriptional regulator of arginine metabolism